MKQVISALIAMTCFAIFALDQVQAQVPKTVSVSFQNKTGIDLVVQGYSTVNGATRPGQTITVRKNGGIAFESNVPVGTRLYNISPANQPLRPVLRLEPILIQNRDVSLIIMVSPTDPKRVVLLPE